MHNIVACAGCGRRNRVPVAAGPGVPRCAECDETRQVGALPAAALGRWVEAQLGAAA